MESTTKLSFVTSVAGVVTAESQAAIPLPLPLYLCLFSLLVTVARERRVEGGAAHCEQHTDALSLQAHNMYNFVGGVCITGSRMRR